MSGTQFAMVSEWMPNGNINGFVKAHQDKNRFELLEDVAKGLIYMHDQRMVHGDLKGVNILIDGTGHARLADFGLLAILSDTTLTSSSSLIAGGTVRWMSPELFCPEDFGLKDSRRTKYSDCYALGMVIYEVLSGQVPFPRYGNYTVVAKVSKGERPGRPGGAKGKWFTDGVWGMLERCWIPKRDDHPRIEDVLRCLEEVSRFWMANPATTNSPTQNPSNSNTGGSTDSEVTSPRASSAGNLSRETSLRRRIAGSHQEGSPSGDAAARGELQHPNAAGPFGTISQIISEWMKRGHPLGAGFFFLRPAILIYVYDRPRGVGW